MSHVQGLVVPSAEPIIHAASMEPQEPFLDYVFAVSHQYRIELFDKQRDQVVLIVLRC